MTKYQSLMEKSEAEERLAIKFAQKGEQALAQFPKKARTGFKEQALNLSLDDADTEIYTKLPAAEASRPAAPALRP